MSNKASSHSEGPEVLGEINVTPLVDVMLVLLIIFMVTAPMIQQQVDVDLPETESEQSVAVKKNDLVLIIDRKQNIKIGSQPVSFETLEEKLKAIYKNKREKEIFLQADKSIPYGFVVQVMAIVKKAGIPKMAMVTDAPEKT